MQKKHTISPNISILEKSHHLSWNVLSSYDDPTNTYKRSTLADMTGQIFHPNQSWLNSPMAQCSDYNIRTQLRSRRILQQGKRVE